MSFVRDEKSEKQHADDLIQFIFFTDQEAVLACILRKEHGFPG